MQWLIETGLSNAVVAPALALVAAVVSRCSRRPALVHALWLLVLLKLITPPILEIPVPVPISSTPMADWLDGDASSSYLPPKTSFRARSASDGFALREAPPKRDPSNASPADADEPLQSRSPEPDDSGGLESAPIRMKTHASVVHAEPRPSFLTNANTDTEESASKRVWRTAIAVWGLGIFVWFGLQVAMALRFQGFMRQARPAESWLCRAGDRIAERAGLTWRPPIFTVDFPVTPMLFGLGRKTCIVLPARLLRAMSPAAQKAVLTHELAHYARGDQWVRVVELVATGIFWWHPIVWWARRGIETAEEACCDSYVLQQNPKGARIYAEAILDVVDFVSERAFRPRPVVASGIGAAPLLRRRLEALFVFGTAPALSPTARRALLAVGVVCLYCAPNFVRQSAGTVQARSVTDVALPGPSRAIERAGLSSQQQSHEWGTPMPQHTDQQRVNSASVRELDPLWASVISPNGRYHLLVQEGYCCELRDVISDRTRLFSEQRITCAAFSSDSKRLVTGAEDGSIRQWDTTTGNPIALITRAEGKVHSLALKGELLAFGDDTGTVQVVRRSAAAERIAFLRMDGPVRCVRFSPTGEQLAVALDTWKSSAGKVVVCEIDPARIVLQWETPAPIGALKYLGDRILLTADWNGHMVAWSLPAAKAIGSARIAKESVSAASFSPDTRALEVGTEEILHQ